MRKIDKVVSACGARLRAIKRGIRYKRITSARKRVQRRTSPGYAHCKNCGNELHGMYCHHCGQYALDIRQPFWKYIQQFMENTYQFDGRLLKTLRTLFCKPGKLTAEFAAGRISSYVHPLKLYMFMSIIFFSFVLLALPSIRNAEQKSEFETLVSNIKERVGEDDEDDDPALDSLEQTEATAPDKATAVAAKADITDQAGETDITDKADNADKVDESLQKQLRDYIFREIRNSVPILMLFLLPLYALILRYQYRKRCKHYMHCFVFALHFHTALLIGISLAVMANVCFEGPHMSKIISIPFYLLFLYLIIAAHRFFGTGWFRATTKAFLGMLLYVLICVTLIILFFVYLSMRAGIL